MRAARKAEPLTVPVILPADCETFDVEIRCHVCDAEVHAELEREASGEWAETIAICECGESFAVREHTS